MLVNGNKIAVAILAGGLNTRFGGETKALININGIKIIELIVDQLRPLAKEIIIVTNNPVDFCHLEGCMIVGDIFLKAGPLGGIHSAMTITTAESLFVVASDMPLINRDVVESQMEAFYRMGGEVFIPVIDDRIEPLHAIYSAGLLPRLEDFLSGNKKRAIREFLEMAHVVHWTPPEKETFTRAVANINTPDDLEEIKKKYIDP